MVDSLGSAAGKLERFARDLETEVARHSAIDTGKQAQRIAATEVAKDLGDQSFSGWRRSNQIELATKWRELKPGVVGFTPTRDSAGPWTVLEMGRNRGNAGGFAGPGVNRRTGATSRTKSGAIRKVRRRKAKRWNGTTTGKGTASRVVDQLETLHPKVVQRRLTKAINSVDRG